MTKDHYDDYAEGIKPPFFSTDGKMSRVVDKADSITKSVYHKVFSEKGFVFSAPFVVGGSILAGAVKGTLDEFLVLPEDRSNLFLSGMIAGTYLVSSSSQENYSDLRSNDHAHSDDFLRRVAKSAGLVFITNASYAVTRMALNTPIGFFFSFN